MISFPTLLDKQDFFHSASGAGLSPLLPAPSPVKAVTGQPLSGAFHSPGLTCRDRGATAMAPPPVSDSTGGPASTAAQVSCSGISHCHLLPHEPSGISPQSTADLTPGSLQDPCAPAPSPAPPRGHASLHPSPGNCMAAARIVSMILIPFRCSQTSCFTLSLECFSSVP